jgi:hypothetical protein
VEREPWSEPSPRAVGLAVVVVASGFLLLLLALGWQLLSLPWWELSCFDGNEAACAVPPDAPTGLGLVRKSSWVLAACAAVADVAAFVLAWRAQRSRQLLPVYGLSAVVAGVGMVLFERVW